MLMLCKARHALCDLLSTNQWNGSEMTFVAYKPKELKSSR